jgi:transcriptional regulator with XRE-family HTH domain
MKNRLKKAREYRGVSMSDLAKMVGVSCASISKAESGHTEMRPRNIRKISMALRVDPFWLLTGVGESGLNHNHAQGAADTLVAALATIPLTPVEQGVLQLAERVLSNHGVDRD